MGGLTIWTRRADGGRDSVRYSRLLAAILALLIPMAVWKGEDPARRGYHHAMPVGHGEHASARVAAGLAWTMAGMAAFFGWMGLLSVTTGGSVDAAEPWQWVAPFAGAAVMYLLGSALTLATSRPWRWLGAGAVGYFFLNAFRGLDATEPLADALNASWRRYGSHRALRRGCNMSGHYAAPWCGGRALIARWGLSPSSVPRTPPSCAPAPQDMLAELGVAEPGREHSARAGTSGETSARPGA